MNPLIILAVILVAIVLLLLSRVRFCLSYNGDLSLSVRYTFFRIRLYPRKPRSRKEKNVEKKPRKRAHITKPPTKKEKKPLLFGDVRFLLSVIKETVESILKKASRHVRIVMRELTLTVGGGDDAARAAIEYGLLSQAAAYLLAYLDNTGFLASPKKGAVNIGVNFLEMGHKLRVRTEIACPLLFLIPLLISSLSRALAARGKWTRYRARAEKQNQKAHNTEGG